MNQIGEMSCPECRRPMVERINRASGSRFMACTGYGERDDRDRPLCSYTQAVPEHVRLRRLGAAALPGFE